MKYIKTYNESNSKKLYDHINLTELMNWVADRDFEELTKNDIDLFDKMFTGEYKIVDIDDIQENCKVIIWLNNVEKINDNISIIFVKYIDNWWICKERISSDPITGQRLWTYYLIDDIEGVQQIIEDKFDEVH